MRKNMMYFDCYIPQFNDDKFENIMIELKKYKLLDSVVNAIVTLCEKYDEDGNQWTVNPVEYFKYLIDRDSYFELNAEYLRNFKLKEEKERYLKKIQELEIVVLFFLFYNDIQLKKANKSI